MEPDPEVDPEAINDIAENSRYNQESEPVSNTTFIFQGYLSDESELELEADEENGDESLSSSCMEQTITGNCDGHNLSVTQEWFPRVPPPPPPKCQCHEVPVRISQQRAIVCHGAQMSSALNDLEKVIKSLKTEMHNGIHELQATHAQAMASYLHMLVRNKRAKIDASVIAAESHGFAPRWGGRMIRLWVWVSRIR
jgi:hypothetical protein